MGVPIIGARSFQLPEQPSFLDQYTNAVKLKSLLAAQQMLPLEMQARQQQVQIGQLQIQEAQRRIASEEAIRKLYANAVASKAAPGDTAPTVGDTAPTAGATPASTASAGASPRFPTYDQIIAADPVNGPTFAAKQAELTKSYEESQKVKADLAEKQADYAGLMGKLGESHGFTPQWAHTMLQQEIATQPEHADLARQLDGYFGQHPEAIESTFRQFMAMSPALRKEQAELERSPARKLSANELKVYNNAIAAHNPNLQLEPGTTADTADKMLTYARAGVGATPAEIEAQLGPMPPPGTPAALEWGKKAQQIKMTEAATAANIRIEGYVRAADERGAVGEVTKANDLAMATETNYNKMTDIYNKMQKTGKITGPDSMAFLSSHIGMTFGGVPGAHTGEQIIQAHLQARDLPSEIEVLARSVLQGGQISMSQATQFMDLAKDTRRANWWRADQTVDQVNNTFGSKIKKPLLPKDLQMTAPPLAVPSGPAQTAKQGQDNFGFIAR